MSMGEWVGVAWVGKCLVQCVCVCVCVCVSACVRACMCVSVGTHVHACVGYIAHMYMYVLHTTVTKCDCVRHYFPMTGGEIGGAERFGTVSHSQEDLGL